MTGRELRGCWTQRPGGLQPDGADQSTVATGAAPSATPAPLRGFIALEDIAPLATAGDGAGAPPVVVLVDALDAGEARTSLFGELDR